MKVNDLTFEKLLTLQLPPVLLYTTSTLYLPDSAGVPLIIPKTAVVAPAKGAHLQHYSRTRWVDFSIGMQLDHLMV
jgi:hypothetical protein